MYALLTKDKCPTDADCITTINDVMATDAKY